MVFNSNITHGSEDSESLQRNKLHRLEDGNLCSLLQYQGVPARGLGKDHLASPYLTNEDNLKRHTSLGGSEREKEGYFLILSFVENSYEALGLFQV